jgi:hypothetical protein
MNHGDRILDHIHLLAQFFAARCADRSTLDELSAVAANREKWKSAHGLFQKIRAKTLEAEGRRDSVMTAQYRFEEACAKTLYNLSYSSAPFDADSPYWIVPTALALAEKLGVPPAEITSRIAV